MFNINVFFKKKFYLNFGIFKSFFRRGFGLIIFGVFN